MNTKEYIAVLLALLLVTAPGIFAGTVSNSVAVPVQLTIPESISLTLSTNSITLSNSQTSQSVILTTSWQLIAGNHQFASLYSYFSALPNSGSGTIASSYFFTAYNGGTIVPCNQSNFSNPNNQGVLFGVAGQNCGTFQLPVNVATDTNDSQAVTLAVSMNASSFNGLIPVGSYTGGVLNIVFQVI
jgi:hypothetical protein